MEHHGFTIDDVADHRRGLDPVSAIHATGDSHEALSARGSRERIGQLFGGAVDMSSRPGILHREGSRS